MPGLTQVQQQEMQFNARTFQCCHIHRIAQIWLPNLKEHLKGQRFSCDEEVKSAVRKWFQKQNINFFKGRFKKLVQHWQKCIEVHGDFVEK